MKKNNVADLTSELLGQNAVLELIVARIHFLNDAIVNTEDVCDYEPYVEEIEILRHITGSQYKLSGIEKLLSLIERNKKLIWEILP